MMILDLLQQGGLTVYPLGAASIVCMAIILERLWSYRGMVASTKVLTRQVVDSLVRRDVESVRSMCEKSKAPAAEIFLDGLRWKNIALEDLDRVLATSRQEAVHEMRRGLWVLGTAGSLAPYVGLFGTVVGIIKAFQQMALKGAGGFEVVAAGISEALVATAAGLIVAILALSFFNYLQIRVGNISTTLSRACERFVQALLYVESATATAPAGGSEVSGGAQHA
jgi:biopolymer transport protein ExbB